MWKTSKIDLFGIYLNRKISFFWVHMHKTDVAHGSRYTLIHFFTILSGPASGRDMWGQEMMWLWDLMITQSHAAWWPTIGPLPVGSSCSKLLQGLILGSEVMERWCICCPPWVLHLSVACPWLKPRIYHFLNGMSCEVRYIGPVVDHFACPTQQLLNCFLLLWCELHTSFLGVVFSWHGVG